MIGALRQLGIAAPTDPRLVEAAVAAGLTIAALAIGWLVSHWLCPRVTDFWTARTGARGERIAPRIGALIRHATAGLLLAIILYAWSWPPIAAFIVGLPLAASVALLTRAVLRGAGLPGWIAWSVAAMLFVALLSNAVGGFAEIRSALEAIGFDVGARRFSLLSLITFLIIGVALYAGVQLANRVLGHSIARAHRLDPTQKLLAQKLAAIAVIVAAFFIGIDLLGIDLTALAVFSGAFGLAIGFGLQKTFGNLIAGIILLWDRSIKPGDVIVVGESFGTVNKIGVRAVSVVTRDGKEHLIPNENLMTQEVENWSYSSRDVRVHIPVGVAYDTDLKRAQELMLQAALDSPRVKNSPKPTIWLIEFGESSVNFEILAWIADPELGVGSVRSDVLNRLWDLFKAHAIEIPFPQRDLHVKSLPEGWKG